MPQQNQSQLRISINSDIVIDANIFAHCNYNNQYSSNCNDFLVYLSSGNCNCKLCFDGEFDTDRAKNKSRIAHEYYEHVTLGTVGYVHLINIIYSGLTKSIERQSFSHYKPKIYNIVGKGKRADIIYIAICSSSVDKLLITNDFDHIIEHRENLEEKLDIKIFNSHELF